MKGHRSASFANSDGEQLEPLMIIQGCLHFAVVCPAGLEQKHRAAREGLQEISCPPDIRRADIKDYRPLRQSRLQQPKNADIFLKP
jgi:hypothetical protein